MKLKTSVYHLLILAICSSVFSGCQLYQSAKFSYANATSTHKWLSNKHTTEIPFTMISELIIVPVSINGSEPLNFVFDSGAAATVILESDNTRMITLNSESQLAISGAGESFQSIANVVPKMNVTLGDIQLIDQTIIHLPISSVPFFKDSNAVFFDGVIGYNFLKRFAIKIDHDSKIITLSEENDFTNMEIENDVNWQQLPISVEGGVSYISVNAQLTDPIATPLKLMIDTGFSGTFQITQNKHKKSVEPYYPTRIQGLNGYSSIHVANSKSLSLGRYSKKDVPVLYNMSTNKDVENSELLGNQYLKHFNVIFDYRSEQLFIKPNQYFEQPILMDRSGLRLMPHKLGAMVNDVALQTGSDKIGLKKGDIITRYNGKKVTTANLAGLTFALTSSAQKVSLCWVSNSNNLCDELPLASRLQAVQ